MIDVLLILLKIIAGLTPLFILVKIFKIEIISRWDHKNIPNLLAILISYWIWITGYSVIMKHVIDF